MFDSLNALALHGVLDWKTFEGLHHNKLLLPLFDGFDELPGDYGAVSPHTRRMVFRDIRSTCSDFFALTSRPGYEAETHIEHQYTLKELSFDQAADHLATTFTTNEHQRRAARKAHASLPSMLATHLRRPLFLAAWCEMIPRDGSAPPTSVNAVMMHLVMRCFDTRCDNNTTTTAPSTDALLHLGLLLGSLVEDGYGHNRDTDALTRTLSWHGTLRNATTLDAIFALARVAGFVVRAAERSWYVIKAPAVEFLIGRALAECAAAQGHELKHASESYRRWIWQPDMHGTLDYMFAALWNGNEVQRLFAHNLLEWTLAVSRSDRPGDPTTRATNDDQCYAQDDLLVPFALSAVRWHSFNMQLDEPAISAARETSSALTTALTHDIIPAQLLSGPLLPWAVLRPIIIGLGAEYHGRRVISEALAWERAILAALGRLADHEAATVVQECVDALSRNDSSHHTFDMPLSAAAQRVPEEEAARMVRAWLVAHDHAERADIKAAWRRAIRAVAMHVSGLDAAGILPELIAAHQSQTDPTIRDEWRSSIVTVIGCLHEAVAAAMLRAWVAEYQRSHTDPELEEFWLSLITNAAGRVGENDAAVVVSDLIARCQTSATKATAALGESAIPEAAVRLKEQEAGDAIVGWLAEHNTDGRTEGAMEASRAAITAAATRVQQTDAARVVAALIQDTRRSQNASAMPLKWEAAIVNAAERVRGNEATSLIKRWIAEHNAPETGQQTKEALRSAIAGAARCVAEADVAALMPHLLDAGISAEDDMHLIEAWGATIAEVASRISETDAASCVQSWIAEHRAIPPNVSADSFWEAVCSAIMRDCEGETASALREWFSALEQAPDDPGVMEKGIEILRTATEGRRDDDAARVIQTYIAAAMPSEDGQDGRPAALRIALWGALRRVPEAALAPLIPLLIAEHNRASDDVTKRRWLLAVSTTAARIAENEAATAVHEWIAAHNEPKNDPSVREAWRAGLGPAAGRVRPVEAAPLILAWTAAYNQAENDPETKKCWREAIWRAAHRVRADDVRCLLGHVIAQLKRSWDDATNKYFWGEMASALAYRVREDDAAGVVRDLFELQSDPHCDDETRKVLHRAVKLAAERATAGSSRVLVCNALIAHGWSDCAFQIASLGTDVALVRKASGDVQERGRSSDDAPGAFLATLRSHMVLDNKMRVVPEYIAWALGGAATASAHGWAICED
ncbi:MAG TPA: hypothetical protein VHC22_17965 [Pirellulales bacterium]|nr:hypothetical protein [Pirellulales bacterium]